MTEKLKTTMSQRKASGPVAFPVTPDNILAAMFSVNRSAKRNRDAAQACYRSSAHGLAKYRRLQKEMCYSLKDRGLVFLYKMGVVSATEKHGSLTVYRGMGYCFHSPLSPDGVTLEQTQGDVTVEAKPRKSTDMRLMDAVETLGQLVAPMDGFSRSPYQPPVRKRWHSEYDDDDSPSYAYSHWDDDDDDDDDYCMDYDEYRRKWR